MKNQHMNPDDAVKTHLTLKSRQSMGIHYGTFVEHPEQTVNAHEKDLAKALEERKIDISRFWVLKFGEGRNIVP
jgi:L-ascorbate metabolism protein UlaG (beta-lactamase superfamily)